MKINKNYNLEQREVNKLFYQVNTKASHNISFPHDFDMWDLVDSSGLILAHAAAKFKHLPSEFNKWFISDKNGVTVAHVAAEYGNLPDSFDQWDLSDNIGTTVAHIAAKFGHLPDSFREWQLLNIEGVTVAHVAAKYKNLPDSFEMWHLKDSEGLTIAHVVTEYKYLPTSFCEWNLADNNGVTVAHVAAKFKKLPSTFQEWHLKDKQGLTVAHVATEYRNLPDSFDKWILADKDGVTVAHLAAKYGNLPTSFVQWDLTDKDGVTVAHLAAKHRNLPTSFVQWNLADKEGATVAHIAAEFGNLPISFGIWDLIDNEGATVAHIAAKFGNLPISFDKWDLKDSEGTTVAHIAAEFGNLPISFDKWHLTDNEGATVAHVAAEFENLPISFDKWDLIDNDSVSVAHIFTQRKSLPEGFDQWYLADKDSVTVAHVAALFSNLPESFNHWGLIDKYGVSVAHIVANCEENVSDLIFKIKYSEWGRHDFEVYIDLRPNVFKLTQKWSVTTKYGQKKFKKNFIKDQPANIKSKNKAAFNCFMDEEEFYSCTKCFFGYVYINKCHCIHLFKFYNIFGLEKYYEININKNLYNEKRVDWTEFWDHHNKGWSFMDALVFYDNSFSEIEIAKIYSTNIYILSRHYTRDLFLDDIDLKYLSSLSKELNPNKKEVTKFIFDFLNYAISLVIDRNHDIVLSSFEPRAHYEEQYKEDFAWSNNPSNAYPCPCDNEYEIEPGELYLTEPPDRKETYEADPEYMQQIEEEEDQKWQEYLSKSKTYYVISSNSVNKSPYFFKYLEELESVISGQDCDDEKFSTYFWKNYADTYLINFKVVPNFIPSIEDKFENSVVVLCVDVLDSLAEIKYFVDEIYKMNAESVYVIALSCDVSKISI